MTSHAWHVFRKDGLELLRDRRTLFVNVVLPVLLYPLLMLFLIQVLQLTQAQTVEPPRVAFIDAPTALVRLVPVAPPASESGEDGESAAKPPARGTGDGADRPARSPLARAARPARVALVELPPAVRDDLRLRMAALHELGEVADDDAERVHRRDDLRAAVLRLLREQRLAAVVVAFPGAADGGQRLAVAGDDAHPEWETADAAIDRAVEGWRRGLTVAALSGAGLDESVLSPVRVEAVPLAPKAETMRARLAAVIPLILVWMAASGSFHPAIDLLAGERERGTLESLLSWPVRRRDIFLGKLAVACAAATLAVLLNLSSLGLTTVLAGSQLAPPGAEGAGGILAIGSGVLLLCFLALLPLVVTLATVSLALAGYAASPKEAQNYLTPVMLVVLIATLVAMIPGTRPSIALDLVPITGPVLALKESLRASSLPWTHLALSTATSLALAAVVVGWAVRLLESERFCYPGLVRAGWGFWRRWGPRPAAPGPLEVIGLYAVCVGAFTLGGGAIVRAGAPAWMQVIGPLVLCIAGPPLVHALIGAYPPRTGLHLAWPRAAHFGRALALIPFALVCSTGLFAVTRPYIPASFFTSTGKQMEEMLGGIGSLPMLLVAVALTPGVCEELLCRGALLAGLRRAIGGWGAAILSAFLFAVLHLTPYRFVPQFALGIILALITLRAGSLLPAILLHVGHNALGVLLPQWLGRELAPGWWPGLGMGVLGWLSMLSIVSMPLRKRADPAPIAPLTPSPTPGGP